MRRAIGIGIVLGILAASAGACGGPRLLMRSASSREIPAPEEGRARVVLALPGASRDVISVLDERGQYLGQLGARTYFTVNVAPGARRFYALADASAYVVGGDLQPGHTYFVVAETSFGRPLRWVAWTPECGADPMTRLTDSRAIEPDPQADPGGMLARQLGNVPQRILEADQELSEMDEGERALRVLHTIVCEQAAGAESETGLGPGSGTGPGLGSEPGAGSGAEDGPGASGSGGT